MSLSEIFREHRESRKITILKTGKTNGETCAKKKNLREEND